MGGSLALLLKFMTNDLKTLLPPEPPAAVSPLANANDHLRQAALNTPPRRTRRANANEPEKIEWGFNMKTGYTPRRGKRVCESHKLREQRCDGRVLVYLSPAPGAPAKTDVRQRCRLCSGRTAFYCTGCRNYFCFGSQGLSKTRIKTIEQRSEDDDFVKPKLHLQMSVYNPTVEEVKSAYVSNSCYLLHHKTAFDFFWEAKHEEEEEMAAIGEESDGDGVQGN
ncbi:hypothetical protein SEMRO_274_G105280.1 [Seminavis robusta]|uniref:Uncharacterized protein n=1 Tax=Seminavis robusta TaxID=568900 RepID=A0A9N8DQU3_9STRA|nr:hypothetical protein SEMRO_274_G105280.1 [Seminavis robusta]|eukprot:Sro274_g105280.1 n/a (223) ;mRNA; r:7731-8399